MSPGFRRKVLTKAARFFDLAVVGCTFLVTLALSTKFAEWHDLVHLLFIRIRVVNAFLAAGYLAFGWVVFSSCGFYQPFSLSSRHQRVRKTFLAASILTGMLFVLRWPCELLFATDRFLIIFWLLTLSALLLCREVGWWVRRFARSGSKHLRNVIIVGEGPSISLLSDRIRREGLGYHVLYTIDVREFEENGRRTSSF
jgi:FlaA1/EpsC-like NDP-sugar epimerase